MQKSCQWQIFCILKFSKYPVPDPVPLFVLYILRVYMQPKGAAALLYTFFHSMGAFKIPVFFN